QQPPGDVEPAPTRPGAPGRAHDRARARDAGRQVRRPQQAAALAQVIEDRRVLPDVVAGREDVDARVEQLFRALRVDALAARCILAVGDHELDLLPRDGTREDEAQCPPAGTAD